MKRWPAIVMVTLFCFGLLGESLIWSDGTEPTSTTQTEHHSSDLRAMFEELWTLDLSGQNETQKEDLWLVFQSAARSLKYPEWMISVKRGVEDFTDTESPIKRRVEWHIGSKYATIWRLVTIVDGEITSLRFSRWTGTCDGEPFGTCCGNDIPDTVAPQFWTTPQERTAIRDAMYRTLAKTLHWYPDSLPFEVAPNELPTAAQIPNIQSIHLNTYDFTPETVVYFAQFSDLQEVKIENATVQDVRILASLQFPNLSVTHLKISDSGVDSNEWIQRPETPCSLQRLRVGQSTGNLMKHLDWFPELYSLAIQGMTISRSDLQYLQSLKKLQSFMGWVVFQEAPGQDLVLENMPELQSFRLIFSYKTLQAAALSNEPRDPTEPSVFDTVLIRGMPNLQRLELEGLANVRLECCENIKTLSARLGNWENGKWENGNIEFAQGQSFPHLEKLTLYTKPLPFQSYRLFADLEGKVAQNAIFPMILDTEDDLQWLERIPDSKRTLTLHLSENLIEKLPFDTSRSQGAQRPRMLDLTRFSWLRGVVVTASSASDPVVVHLHPKLQSTDLTLVNVLLSRDSFSIIERASGVDLSGRSVAPNILSALNDLASGNIVLRQVTLTDTRMFQNFLANPRTIPSRGTTISGRFHTVTIEFSEETVQQYRGETIRFGSMRSVNHLTISAPGPGLVVSIPAGQPPPIQTTFRNISSIQNPQ